MQVEALVLCSDVTLQRVFDMHSAPWFRAYSLLQRCCPRLDLTAYVERCVGLTDPTPQLVRLAACVLTAILMSKPSQRRQALRLWEV